MCLIGTAVSFLVFSLLAGCGGEQSVGPELGKVSGIVTMNGQPLGSASVVFESASGQVSFGDTNDAGVYEMNYGAGKKGAALGDNNVRISTATDNPVDGNWKDPIPKKYNSKTELKAQVSAGENEINFELLSK